MKLIGVIQLAASLALFVFGSSLYFWLNFCFEPYPFRFPAPPGDCYLVNTSQPHIGLAFGFIASVAVTVSVFVSSIGFFLNKLWARRLAIIAAGSGACAFLVLGSVSSGLRTQFYIVAALLVLIVGILRIRLSGREHR